MALDENPEFGKDGIKSHQTPKHWLMQHERGLYIVTGILTVIVLLLSAQILGFTFVSKPGGLAGCLTNAAGEPIKGAVHVGNITNPVYDDGCFFFSELTPGSHELTIETSNGFVLKQEVKIVSGQAVELGKITVE